MQTSYVRFQRLVRALTSLLAVIGVLAGSFAGVQPAQAAANLTVRIIAAPNLIVDSNVLTPATEQPIVATVIGEFCNISGSTMNNVVGYIGNGTTPGTYPVNANPVMGSGGDQTDYLGNYSFTHLGGVADATRYIGDIPANTCRYQYWSFTYPKTARYDADHDNVDDGLTADPVIPSWGNSVKPADDLQLQFVIWGNYSPPTGQAISTATHTATLRNEISAMANKIEPNGNPGGTWFNTDTSTVLPGQTVVTNGILYRLGNVNKGFDNDNNGTPDYNAWLQPFGNPAYDPSCFRLIKTTGIVTATTTSGDVIIPFVDNLYFTDLPSNNTNVVGLVFYEFLALGGACTIPISPYQEAASGSDNEKFNGDYGAGPAPIATYKPAVTLTKGGNPATVIETQTVTYQMPFANTGGASAGLTLSVGGVDMPLVIQDTVPNGMRYVCGSLAANTTLTAPNTYTPYYSTDSGTTWNTIEPSCPVTSTSSSLVMLRWKLSNPVPAGSTGNVAGFQAMVPNYFVNGSLPAYPAHDPFIENCADAKFGTSGPSFAQACTTTMVRGNNSIGDFIWKDTDGDGTQDGGTGPTGEPGLDGITIKLYWDKNANGTVDGGEPQINAVSKNIINGYLNYDGDAVTNGDADDDGEFDAYDAINGLIDVNGDGSITTADDGTALIGGYNIIDGYIDVDGDGTVNGDTGDLGSVTGTTAATRSVIITDGQVNILSGTFNGYNTNPTGRLDINGDGAYDTGDDCTACVGGFNTGSNTVVLYRVIDGYIDADNDNSAAVPDTGDDATISGTYGFAYLPSKSYIVQVNTNDTDITSGYTPTTAKKYGVNLSAGNVNNRTSDFGFGPTLKIDKHLDSLDPAVVGELVTFHIDLKNMLPGDGTSQSFCQYNVWSTAVLAAGSHTGTTGWVNRPGAYDSATGPNGNLASINPASNSDVIAASSFGLNLPSGVSIRKVEAIYSLYIDGQFSNDHLQAYYWRGATSHTTGDIAMADINKFGPGGTKQGLFVWNVTALDTWSAADFNGTALEVGFQTQKTGGSSGDTTLRLDAMGFRVTTDQLCGGADSTISLLPLTDTYDASMLEFVSATPPESSRTAVGSSGIITWTHVNTLYAGGETMVAVTFKARAITSSATVDTATSANAKFATGRAVNTPVSDTASVNIQQAGSISGYIWSDQNGSGWSGTTGWNAGDTFIPGAEVELWGCYNIVSGLIMRYSTDTNGARTCMDATNGGEWRKITSTLTNSGGYYTFGGLRPGYYDVRVLQSSLPPGYDVAASRRAEPDPTTPDTGLTCGTCDGQWNSDNLNNNVAVDDLREVGGDHATHDSYTISNVSFGFQDDADTQGAVMGYVWRDDNSNNVWNWTDTNGNGVWDSGEGEPPIPGATVYLCSDAADTTCNAGTANYTAVTTDANGRYAYGNVTPGTNFRVGVNRAGDLPAMTQTGDPDVAGNCSGGVCDDQTTPVFSVALNQVVSTNGTRALNFGYTGGLTIGDTVYTDWNGDGSQNSTTSEPGIAGVTVYLYRDHPSLGTVGTYDAGIDIYLAQATTASNGTYSFTNLPGGTNDYIVVVAGNIPAGYVQTGDPEGGCTTGAATCDGRDFIANIGSPAGNSYLLADFGYQPRDFGLIGDRVWLDANGNGAQDSNEVGQPNISMQLIHDTDGDGIIDTEDAVVSTTVTLNYRIIDGYIDLNRNGTVPGDAGDTSTLYSTTIITGSIDINRNGTIGILDDGTFLGYNVIDGRLDVNNDGVVNANDDASLIGYYQFSNLATTNYIVQVAPAELASGGDLVGYSMTNSAASYNASQTSYKTTLTAGLLTTREADFGFATTRIGDFIWADLDGDGLADANEPGIAKVLVQLYQDANNDGLLTGADGSAIHSMETMYNVINGYLDVDKDGITNGDAGDNGTLVVDGTTYTIINGLLDINGVGGITIADDGTFAGYSVIDGYFDMDGDGVTAADAGDDGDTLGIYLFIGVPAGNYIVSVNIAQAALSGYRLTADPDIYNLTYPDSVSCLTTGAVGCDGIKPFDRYAAGATVNGRLMDENPAIRGGSNEMTADFGYQPTAYVGDSLWIDTNGDGERDPDEPGIPYVTVWLCNSSPCNAGSAVATTTTDENGTYGFGGSVLTTGTRYVAVDTTTLPTGILQTYDPVNGNNCDADPLNLPSTCITSPSVTIDLTRTAGGPPAVVSAIGTNTCTVGVNCNLNVDFGYRFWGTSAINGTVWHDTDNGGQPIPPDGPGDIDPNEPVRYANVPVYLYRCGPAGTGVCGDGDDILIGEALTDANGQYNFPTLGTGVYKVYVNDNALSTSGLANTTPTFYSPIALGTGVTARYDFGYRAASGISNVGNFVWTDNDYDGIQDVGEPGASGVTVELHGSGGYLLATTTTDATGAYSFPLVLTSATSYYLVFGAPEFTLQDQGGNDATDSDANAAGRTATFTINPATDDLTRDAGLPPIRAAIGNSVWLDENGDGYQDAGEAGIPNATVELWNAGHTGSALQTTTTDANGNYIFTNLIPGTYQIDVSSVPAGLVATTLIGGTADFTNKAEPLTVVAASGSEALYADFGYNWAPPTDTDNNTNTGAIGDRLWIDDGDGVQEPGEPGLGGVSVQLLTPGPDGILGTADDVVAATTTSAPDGSYIFDGLTAGAYAIRVNGGTAPAGYTPTGDPDQPNALCTTCDNRTTTPILLAPGDVYVNADFGYQPTLVADRWNIGDTLWLDVDRGNDVDAGEPRLPGVTVALIRDLNANGSWDSGEPIIASDVTDSSGNYLFTNVPIADGLGTDDYLVWVNDTDHVIFGLTPVYDSNGAGTPNISAVTNMGAADDLAQDFGYAPAGHDAGEGLIGDTIFYDRANLGTYDLGEGLEGVRASLYRDANNDNLWDAGDVMLASTTSSENGSYYFGGLAPGEYVVRIDTTTLPTGVTNTVDPDTASPGNDQSAVTLAAGGTNLTQDFGYRDLTTPNTIAGTLWYDTNADGVLDAGETTRFDGITIVLRNSAGNIIATTTTAGGGNYTFANLPDGTFSVDVSDDTNRLDGYWHSLGTAGTDNNSQVDPYTVTVTGGQTDASGDFGYYRDPAIIGDRVWHDANGNGIQDGGELGIANIEVILTVIWPGGGGTSTLTTRTGATGLYTFGNLLADEDFNGIGAGEPVYQITVNYPSSYAPTPINQGADDTIDSDGTIIPAFPQEGTTNDTYDCGLAPLAGVIGNAVWLDEDGNGYQDAGEAGIANATVQLWNAGHTVLQATTTTDANGNYVFKNVVPGTYVVDVSSLPAGLVATTIIGGTADFTNKASPFTVVVAASSENLYADFGYNWAPPTDTDNNTNTGAIGDRLWIDDGDGVQEPGEPGLYNVSVQLLTPGPDGILGTGDDVVVATTTTSYDGSYIFDGLAAGGYAIRVNGGAAPTNYTQTGDPDQPGTLCTTCDNRTTTPILLAPGDVYVNADFGYTPTAGNGGNIGDTLWLDVDRDNTVDAGELLLAGVTVALIRDLNANGTWDSGEPIIASDVTDTNGTYLFTNIPVADGAGTDDYLVWVNDTESVLYGLFPTYDSDGVVTPNISVVANLAPAGNLAQDFAYAPFGHVAGNGLIGDTIFYDRDAGNDYDLGEGMEGVRVSLYLDVNNNNVWDAGDTLLASTTSSENGSYYFGGLAAGEYVVFIDTTTLPAGITNTVDPDTASPGNSQSAVTLAAGGTNLVQDFGYFTSTAPNSILGTLWRDVNADGTLSGESGVFENITLVLRNSNGNIVGTTTTNASGNYFFNNLPDGTYTVDVTDDNNLLDGYWHSDGPNDGADNNSQPDPYTVTVTGGGVNPTGDFGYYRQTSAIGNFTWHDSDSDGIQDGGEPGMTGVEIILTVTWPGGSTSTLRTTTDAGGLYTFGNLLLDEDFNGIGGGEPIFNVSVVPPTGYLPSPMHVGGDITVDSGDPLSEAATPTEATSDLNADFGFVPTNGAIGDFVWLDEDSDGIQDAGESGIPNITVELWDAANTTLLATTVTDIEGKYIFTNLAPASYNVTINGGLPVGLTNRTYDYDGTGSANTTAVTLVSGQEMLSADFGYNWSTTPDVTGNTGNGSIGDRLWIDDGDGVQEPGEPGLGGISVALINLGADGIIGTADDTTTTTTSNATGNYIFDDQPAGAYVVRINGGTTPTGYTPTGDPDLPGALCTTCDNRTTTPILLAPGDVYVNADFGYQPGATNGGYIGDTIWLDANRDDLVGAGEPRLAGVTVALIRNLNGDNVWDAGEPIIATTTTDANGNYLFTNVPADALGTYDYLVWVNDTQSVLVGLVPTYDSNGVGTPNLSLVANLAAAGDLNQDFAYAPSGHDAGDGLIGDTIFLDRDGGLDYDPGEGLEGVMVHLYDAAGTNLLASTLTNENGQYFFGNLGTATYVVRVNTNTLPTGLTNTVDPNTASPGDNRSTVILAAGGINLAQDFGYDGANTISGTIWRDTNADGSLTEAGRFNNVTVALYNSGGNLVATTTTSGGDFTFANLPDGTYRVDVTDENNVLDGFWHSTGATPGADNNSQADPYSVTVPATPNTTADFGYFRDPASVGNFVWLDRANTGLPPFVGTLGVQDVGEPGIKGITVTLTINYPGLGGSINYAVQTGANGAYSFGNLLLDENTSLADSGAGTPTYTIGVATPPGMTASPENATAATNDDQLDGDSDGASEIATVVKGETDNAYDFGFTAAIDLGDLPDTYRTYFSPGPANVVFPDGADADSDPDTTGGRPAVWLGLLIDTELDGQPSATARGDDNDGQDDEDGLTLSPSGWIPNATRPMTVTVNSDAHGVRVHYGIWIDWNQDSTFDTFITGSALSGSPQTVSVSASVPGSYVANTSVYFRVRASDQPLTSADYQGTLVNGETEDFTTTFLPTAVEVAELRAVPALPPNWLLTAAALLLLASLGSVAALAYARKRK
jgi:protocatechuate 3,4-dioxygenase beta subunit